ncbi:acyloxyacyl hydrolase [Minwuia sp.]|uniref:acyloxyacyl hydrolase n=1 Tax=Minwuia sp. TaxID=2493630 RepID=UPI003A9267BA
MGNQVLARIMRSGAEAVIFGLMGILVFSQPASAEPPSFFSLGAGYYDPIKGDRAAGEGRIEYRHGERFWIFKPFAGATVTTDPSYFGYAGVLTDVYFGKRLVVSPSVAVGAYLRHRGKNMGSIFQIRSGLEVAYRFDNRVRVSLMFYHFSNAGLGDDRNPGSEAVSLTYSIPLN